MIDDIIDKALRLQRYLRDLPREPGIELEAGDIDSLFRADHFVGQIIDRAHEERVISDLKKLKE